MAVVTPGTNATITAATAEAQLFYSALLLQHYEGSITRNPQKRDYLNCGFDHNKLIFTASFAIICTPIVSAAGNPGYKAANYLDNDPFSPGDPPGTFKSLNLPSYFLEIVTYCEVLEQGTESNPGKANNVTYTYSADQTILNGSVKLGYSFTLNQQTGNLVITPTPYLANA